MKMFTWLDVERILRKKTANYAALPKGIQSFHCFYDAIEIGVDPEKGEKCAHSILNDWFGEWYDEQKKEITLDLGNAKLKVELINEDSPFFRDTPPKPLWQEVIYLKNYIDETQKKNQIPEPRQLITPITGFHSFKGGVGRTTALMCYVFALIDKAPINKKTRLLIIDSDIEAPGITYWVQKEGNRSRVSFINYLEAIHYPPEDEHDVVDFFSEELQRSSISHTNSEIFILPAFTNEEQLFDTPILPENITKGVHGPWNYTKEIEKLGSRLNVDHIFVDMRAGLSEISSPLLFDPRVENFLVTTIAEQSIRGTSMVLRQLAKMMRHFPYRDEDESADQFIIPNVILSMLTEDLKKLDEFEQAISILNEAFDLEDPNGGQSDTGQLPLIEMPFAQDLMSVSSWEEAHRKLTQTAMTQMAQEWAEDKFCVIQPKISVQSTESDIVNLKDICEKYEFAERGESADFLITDPITNMVKRFNNEPPRIVSIGAKGAGKTFCYLQIARVGLWSEFIKKVSGESPVGDFQGYLFPLLHPTNLDRPAQEILNKTRDDLYKGLGASNNFIHSEFFDKIVRAVKTNSDFDHAQWSEFWLSLFSEAIGYENPTPAIKQFNNFLKERNVKIIFLIDGLEDIFTEIANNTSQQRALNALLLLPNRISEIRDLYWGLIVFVRRDFIKHCITQNRGQFESLYASYTLSWNATSFLKLVYWICAQAHLHEFQNTPVTTLTNEQILEKLELLWGRKLGRDKSNEANTARWVYAALTDFKGRLQARDIVRILLYASKMSLELPNQVKTDLWKESRTLPPVAIRRSLEPCSKKKISEAKEEFPDFKKWFDQFEKQIKPSDRVVPFTAKQYDLTSSVVEMLVDMGVIMESEDTSDGSMKFYMPEIYRSGLQFNMKRGARPKVLALKRKALGKDLF
ncbi:MAG: hypothetical protein R6V54_12590 [Desulfobacteraceae bacterium]